MSNPIPPNVRPMPGQPGYPQYAQGMPPGHPQQQQQQPQHHAPPQAHHPTGDQDQKNLQDIIEALTLIGNMRDDINIILDNVGKSNPTNPYASAYQSFKTLAENQSAAEQTKAPGQPSLAALSEADQNQLNEFSEKFSHMDPEQLQYFEQTDSNYLMDRVSDISKNLGELERVMKDIRPIQLLNLHDLNACLLDQSDEKSSPAYLKIIYNYRWIFKLQELLHFTTISNYKRFSIPYNERKSFKHKTQSQKLTKKEDLEKQAAQYLTNNEIKVTCAQKTEHQFVLDILMPQHFKFVFLLFDSNVEKLQVRPMDNRLVKVYASNMHSDEICSFDFESRNLSNVFQRLEDNCLFACMYFKTEFGNHHFRYILQWIKNFSNLFNAKCIRCEKHLLNGVPPTWRDLKTSDPYHDECRI